MTTCLFTIGLVLVEIGVYYCLVKSIKEIQEALQQAKLASKLTEENNQCISAFTSTDKALVAYRYSGEIGKKKTLSKTAGTPQKGGGESRIPANDFESAAPYDTVPTEQSQRQSQ